jgi:cell division protease FtsH
MPAVVPGGSPNSPTPNQEPQGPGPRAFSWPMLLILAFMLVGMWLWRTGVQAPSHQPVDYSTLFNWIAQGKLESVVVTGQSVQGKLKTTEQLDGRSVIEFSSVVPLADDALMQELRKQGVRVRVSNEEQPLALQILLALLPWALIIGLWWFMAKRLQKSLGSGGPFGFNKSKSRKFERSSSVNVTFDDVAGLKSAKQDLQEIVQFMREPERFRKLGGKIPRGVLLVGPPGTGKTLLARAVAGESGVAFFSISASEFVEMFVGMGAARVRELFAEAKKAAPAIVFIDEIDAVGRSRGAGMGGGHDEREQTLNQLLSEMDGFDRNDMTVVLAATNRPDVLDAALLRPGRFDRRVVIDRPELAARLAILNVHTKGKPLGPDVDLTQVAKNTPGFSGADLANLVNEAALGATRRNAEVIEKQDFTSAYDKIVLGDPREAMLAPEEKNRVAVHEAGHAVVARFSAHSEPPSRVSIIPRGMALGVTQQTPVTDRHILTQVQLQSRLQVLMGGYAAERSILGDISTGAENDLKQATELASKMVAHYGMSEKFGPVHYDYASEHLFLGQKLSDGNTSDATVHAIEAEARTLLTHALNEAKRLIRERRADFDRLVLVLLEQETAELEQLAKVFGDPIPSAG